MSYSQVVDLLNDLLSSHYHAENAYKMGIDHSEDSALKYFFIQKASEKSRMINQLTDAVFKLNGTPVAKEKASHKAADLWSSTVLFFKGNTKDAIIEECKKAEKSLLEEYHEVLKYSSITNSTRDVLEEQRDAIAKGIEKSYEL